MFLNINTDKNTEYKEKLKNKKVAIIGPAPYLVSKNMGKKFDKYDFIVRFQKSFPVLPHRWIDYGKRTSALYHCMSQIPANGGPINYKELVNQNTWLISSYPDIFPFSKDFPRVRKELPPNLKFRVYNKELFLEVKSLLKTRPNTGFMAIIDILGSDASSIDIFGMTFFKGNPGDPQYIKEYRDISYKQLIRNTEQVTHRQEPQIKLFKEILHNFNHINIDNELKKVIDNV